MDIVDRFGNPVNPNKPQLILTDTPDVAQDTPSAPPTPTHNDQVAAILQGLSTIISGATVNDVDLKLSGELILMDGYTIRFRNRPLLEIGARITHHGATQLLEVIEKNGEGAGELREGFADGLRSVVANIEAEFGHVIKDDTRQKKSSKTPKPDEDADAQES